ncbi:hypothetical protein DFH07DRAFT_786045 [Mycena maculata]|uniref:Uncharacterized protein n=1 Tax=Mycena maculata TaxID=230809 RepID=A0AAD7H481_9AGAR|nr:hypothetical protein DFH07DRAFT_786045 [Mycena maculata]
MSGRAFSGIVESSRIKHAANGSKGEKIKEQIHRDAVISGFRDEIVQILLPRLLHLLRQLLTHNKHIRLGDNPYCRLACNILSAHLLAEGLPNSQHVLDYVDPDAPERTTSEMQTFKQWHRDALEQRARYARTRSMELRLEQMTKELEAYKNSPPQSLSTQNPAASKLEAQMRNLRRDLSATRTDLNATRSERDSLRENVRASETRTTRLESERALNRRKIETLEAEAKQLKLQTCTEASKCELERVREELDDARHEAKQTRSDVRVFVVRKSKIPDVSRQLNAELERLRLELEDANTARRVQSDTSDRLKGEQEEQERMLRRACDALERVHGELDDERNNLKHARSDLKVSNFELDRIRLELALMLDDQVGLQAKLEASKSKFERVRGELDDERKNSEQASSNLNDAKTQLDRLRLELEDTHSARRVQSEKSDKLQGELDEQDKVLGRLRGELDEKDKVLGRLRGELDEKDKVLGRLRGELDEKDKVLGRLRCELEKKNQECAHGHEELEGAHILTNLAHAQTRADHDHNQDPPQWDMEPPDSYVPQDGEVTRAPVALLTGGLEPMAALSSLLPHHRVPDELRGQQPASGRPAKVPRLTVSHEYAMQPAMEPALAPVRFKHYTIQYGPKFQASPEDLQLERAPGGIGWAEFYTKYKLDKLAEAQMRSPVDKKGVVKSNGFYCTACISAGIPCVFLESPTRVNVLRPRCIRCLSTKGHCHAPSPKNEEMQEAVVRYHNTAVHAKKIPGQWMGDGEPEFYYTLPVKATSTSTELVAALQPRF